MSSKSNASESGQTPALKPKPNSKGAPKSAGFGMFGGVFTPCTLTILGVIMFLRFGYVVGNAGLLWALVILAAAKRSRC